MFLKALLCFLFQKFDSAHDHAHGRIPVMPYLVQVRHRHAKIMYGHTCLGDFHPSMRLGRHGHTGNTYGCACHKILYPQLTNSANIIIQQGTKPIYLNILRKILEIKYKSSYNHNHLVPSKIYTYNKSFSAPPLLQILIFSKASPLSFLQNKRRKIYNLKHKAKIN